jgi:hypothetical protein
VCEQVNNSLYAAVEQLENTLEDMSHKVGLGNSIMFWESTKKFAGVVECEYFYYPIIHCDLTLF